MRKLLTINFVALVMLAATGTAAAGGKLTGEARVGSDGTLYVTVTEYGLGAKAGPVTYSAEAAGGGEVVCESDPSSPVAFPTWQYTLAGSNPVIPTRGRATTTLDFPLGHMLEEYCWFGEEQELATFAFVWWGPITVTSSTGNVLVIPCATYGTSLDPSHWAGTCAYP
jgi:hypothetical protein